MFRLWAREFKDGKLVKDITISDMAAGKSRTKKIFSAVDEVCYEFDLSTPVWFEKNIKEFKHRDKTRFNQDNFIDSVGFDYLEIQIIEED